MMEITFTCDECGSGINVYPSETAKTAECPICHHQHQVNFSENVLKGELDCCPKCDRKDFYKQKDFNRKIGVIIFLIGAAFVPWTYGISIVVAAFIDMGLYQILPDVASCYKCNTLFRKIENMDKIEGFNHEMNDRIVYSDHDFEGKPLPHH